MNIYFAIAVACMLYFGVFYYLLLFGNGENFFGMYALSSFFGLFLFLGLGGIEVIIALFTRKQK
jgi:hypothetical protein